MLITNKYKQEKDYYGDKTITNKKIRIDNSNLENKKGYKKKKKTELNIGDIVEKCKTEMIINGTKKFGEILDILSVENILDNKYREILDKSINELKRFNLNIGNFKVKVTEIIFNKRSKKNEYYGNIIGNDIFLYGISSEKDIKFKEIMLKYTENLITKEIKVKIKR